jgi:hypothetical protein
MHLAAAILCILLVSALPCILMQYAASRALRDLRQRLDAVECGATSADATDESSQRLEEAVAKNQELLERICRHSGEAPGRHRRTSRRADAEGLGCETEKPAGSGSSVVGERRGTLMMPGHIMPHISRVQWHTFKVNEDRRAEWLENPDDAAWNPEDAATKCQEIKINAIKHMASMLERHDQTLYDLRQKLRRSKGKISKAADREAAWSGRLGGTAAQPPAMDPATTLAWQNAFEDFAKARTQGPADAVPKASTVFVRFEEGQGHSISPARSTVTRDGDLTCRRQRNKTRIGCDAHSPQTADESRRYARSGDRKQRSEYSRRTMSNILAPIPEHDHVV